MIAQILSKTPLWVWFLLAGLIALGVSQSRTKVATLKRVAIMPVLMTGLSFAGVLSAFGARAVLVWLLAACMTGFLVSRTAAPLHSAFDPVSRCFTVPGSWLPMVMILGIFITKYVVGVSSAMHPAWPQDLLFSSAFSALYGLFSGVFVGRAARLIRLAGLNTGGALVRSAA